MAPAPSNGAAGAGGNPTEAPIAAGGSGGEGADEGTGGATADPDDSGTPAPEDSPDPQPVELGPPVHEARATLPTVRQEHAAVALNGEVYVLGGFTPSVTTSVQAYDPESDTWRDVADFPEQFHHPNVSVVNGRIYVTGFHRGSSLTTADARSFVYDPSTDEWTARAPLATARGTSCVGVLGSEIYVFGGASNTTIPDASVYDTELDSWRELPPMPELREHCVGAGIGGKIHIVSGRSGGISGLQVASWTFDPETQTYEERAGIPTPRGGAAGAVLHGRIFVFGGEGNSSASNGIFTEVEAYDPVMDTWSSFPDMLIPRHGYAAATVADRIYLPGGATRQGFGAEDDHTVFYFTPAD